MTEIEHKEIDGYWFALIPIIPFEDWFTQRFGKMDKFYQLNRKDKEKIFLRWKWGFLDDRANEQIDFTEIATLNHYKDCDLSKLSEGWRFYIVQKRNFARICQETRKLLGLTEVEYNPLVEKVIETYDGREI